MFHYETKPKRVYEIMRIYDICIVINSQNSMCTFWCNSHNRDQFEFYNYYEVDETHQIKLPVVS